MKVLSDKHPLAVWERDTSDARTAIHRMQRDRQVELDERCGVYTAEDEFDEIWDEMQEVGRVVYDTPARTLDGLRAKVLALKLLAWADDVDDEWWPSIRRDILTISRVGSASIVVQDEALSPSESDPIFAAIQQDRSAYEAFFARCRIEDEMSERGEKRACAPGDYRTPEMVAAVNRSRAARAALANTTPTTPEGLAAYLNYVVEWSFDEVMFGDDEETQIFIRTLRRSVFELLSALPSADRTEPPADDETPRLIAAHRAAFAAIAGPDDVIDQLSDAEDEHRTALWAARPTTRASLDAYLEYWADLARRDGDGFLVNGRAFSDFLSKLRVAFAGAI
ncbi:hypothetical protein [Pseudolabrys taiwanensis]|nr:hypothetical protein [Pseudolabrys taiwanensis]